jgi:hypothetical protein
VHALWHSSGSCGQVQGARTRPTNKVSAWKHFPLFDGCAQHGHEPMVRSQKRGRVAAETDCLRLKRKTPRSERLGTGSTAHGRARGLSPGSSVADESDNSDTNIADDAEMQWLILASRVTETGNVQTLNMRIKGRTSIRSGQTVSLKTFHSCK